MICGVKIKQMRKRIAKYIYIVLLLVVSIAFVAKFAGPYILRLYIKSGIGDCRKIPLFCMTPVSQVKMSPVDNEFLAQLVPYRFPKMSVMLPKGFSVVQETVKKVYYKKQKHRDKGSVVYLLHQDKDFFISLFPQLKHSGVNDDYEFMRRVMFANVETIANLTDAFFVIMKGVFIPSLGDQHKVVMISFSSRYQRGFINYNTSAEEHYFDCNVIDASGAYFKVYIKDINGVLDLDKVLAVISTLREED